MEKKSFKLMLCAVLLFLSGPCQAFRTETVGVFSESMSKSVPTVIVLPDSYDGSRAYPTVYLLHGYGDNHLKWTQGGHADSLSDEHQVILVMPDGGVDSWYWDSEVTPEYRYETFTSKELVEYVDQHYRTMRDCNLRAITGLSMGGQGAMYLAIRHPEVFGVVGSMSGGLDIRPFPDSWGMSKRLGSLQDHQEAWDAHSITEMVKFIKKGTLKIAFEVGQDDFFLKVNEDLHQKLLKAGIDHDFTLRPESHNWTYWSNAVKYQLLFFRECFHSYLEVKADRPLVP